MSGLRFACLALAFSMLAGCAQLSPPTQVIQPSLPPPRAETSLPTNPPAPASSTSPTPTNSPQSATPPATTAARLPDPAAYRWQQVVDGLEAPTDIQSAGDGSGRLFVLEKPGRIRIIKDGRLQPTPFLDITGQVGSLGSEQGLLGLAFHPKFSQNGYFFVNYTDQDGNTHIARFIARGDAADPASEKRLLFVQQPFANHNGGGLAFDPSGMLVIGLGDGGSQGDPYGNGQSKNTFLGKLLRLNVDTGDPYAIPADNPFASAGGRAEIWYFGLRNPWRFSFDRQTGDLWIADVGQDLWEEIDFVPAGKTGGLNFGWNAMEGKHPYKGVDQPGFTPPVAEYSHAYGCAVTGGYVYRGSALPAWQGVYFFGDYCSGRVWGLPSPPNDTQPVQLYQTNFKISTFGVDDAGELYLADYAGGSIYKLVGQ